MSEVGERMAHEFRIARFFAQCAQGRAEARMVTCLLRSRQVTNSEHPASVLIAYGLD